MSNRTHVDLMKQGRPQITKFRTANPTTIIDWSGEDLSKLGFEHLDLGEVNCERTRLFLADLSDTTASNANFRQADLGRAVLSRATLASAQFQGATLIQTVLHNAKLENAVFEKATVSEADFNEARLDGASFKEAVAHRTKFQKSTLTNADFSGADLHCALLDGADLSGADLRGANLHGSSLAAARVVGAKITRVGVEDLRADNLAGLRPSQLRDMIVEDGYGELRNYFSGFWTFVHLISIALWLTPIGWIVGKSLLLSVTPNALQGRFHHMTLLAQVWGYWMSGALAPTSSQGQPHYEIEWWFFGTWGLVLLYNIARFALVLRVKLWEHGQMITGLYPDVRIKGWLKTAFLVVGILFWANLSIVLIHFVHFLLSEFPVYLST